MKHYNNIRIGIISIGFTLGVLLAKFGVLTNYSHVFLLFILLIYGFRNKNILSLIIFFLLLFNLGLLQGKVYFEHREFFQENLYTKISVYGKVVDDPTYHESSQYEFHIANLYINGDPKKGKLRARSYQTNGIQRGSIVKVEGKLTRALGNKQGSINYAKVEVLYNDQNFLLAHRNKFFNSIYSALPAQEASLGIGFLLGIRSFLPENLEENLRTTGLTHIVAVSGYNLTIIILLLRKFLAKFSKYLAVSGSFALVLAFLFLVGDSPSVIRASVVSFLGLLAWYYGRKSNPINILLISGAISCWLNPYYLWFDLGWYLSFLAFFGVLVIAPLIQRRLFKKSPRLIGSIILETSSAQLMTLPLIMFIFSDMSVISLLANVIVLPLIPMAMASTFLVGVLGIINIDFARLISWSASYILGFIIEITNLLANIPGALIEVKFSLNNLILMFSIILFLTFMLYRRQLVIDSSDEL